MGFLYQTCSCGTEFFRYSFNLLFQTQLYPLPLSEGKKSRIYRFLNERNPVLIAVKGRGHEKNKNDFGNKGSLDEGNEEWLLIVLGLAVITEIECESLLWEVMHYYYYIINMTCFPSLRTTETSLTLQWILLPLERL